MSAFACGASQMKSKQLDSLQALVTKHIQDPALASLDGGDFARTSVERGLQRWEQAHLVAALDVLNAYQRDRRARAGGIHVLSVQRSFRDDARTKLCELLKRWLRANASCSNLSEEEVRSMCGLCRDVLNHPQLFPARNPRSFLCTIAEVYDHLRWQLREVLERDRSCADLAQRLVSLSRNLISDALAFLLLAPTDLVQTDALPSLEVVSLWQSLPDEGHPLPERADATLQKTMREAWRTRWGAVIAALLSTPWCLRLYAGADAAAAAAGLAARDSTEGFRGSPVLARLVEARDDFNSGRYRGIALVGALRGPAKVAAREHVLEAAVAIFDLTYLLGEVMLLFHRISDGLGDYGMIRVSAWLHPILEVFLEKLQRLKFHLEKLNSTLDDVYVLGRARGQPAEKPAPSSRMCARAHAAIERALLGRACHYTQLIERALLGRACHYTQLTQLVDELKSRSAPERLPHVAEGISDACSSLQGILGSEEFRAHVGDSFPELPFLGGTPSSNGDQSALRDRAEPRALLDVRTSTEEPAEPGLPTLLDR
eukprot:CAMPEP_0115121764 /NCGR_PEP_ID=MMETSP0227-20121206/46432_1 /TAXON_ID=89957 /ORGANISM="Polarella glacialis, Strain CCMP 1383" /LENGTH=542 /DNA_ID=CAMNT_0002523589 /DNA_START=182 /DNA_END=1807 /DNA_ORIENTATION=+